MRIKLIGFDMTTPAIISIRDIDTMCVLSQYYQLIVKKRGIANSQSQKYNFIFK